MVMKCSHCKQEILEWKLVERTERGWKCSSSCGMKRWQIYKFMKELDERVKTQSRTSGKEK